MLDSDLEKYKTTHLLGSGAFGEVRLMEHTEYPKIKMAAKIMPTSKTKEENARREFLIHRYLCHENIVKMLDMRKTKSSYFLFMEFVEHGDIFDRIPKDIGMSPKVAQRYYKQLIKGVKYLHGKGVVHRDIKPENLLIGRNDTIKLCDFGCARKFLQHEKEIMLSGAAGTSEYGAPELHSQKEYQGPPIDVWSSGVTLMVLLTGLQPWRKADGTSKRYGRWLEQKKEEFDNWHTIDRMALQFLRFVVNADVSERLTIEEIESSPWMNYDYEKAEN